MGHTAGIEFQLMVDRCRDRCMFSLGRLRAPVRSCATMRTKLGRRRDPMPINASLTGRLRNTSLPKSRALMPLFEAVVNAIQAVDEAHSDMDSTLIEIVIVRDQQIPLELGDDSQTSAYVEPINSFIVIDNGEGFHNRNMESFETLDSEYRSAYGCRGVGRLLWLKAFEKVEVISRYVGAEETMKEREF